MKSVDLFTKARLKITFLYFLLGVVILVIAGFFVYSDLTAIIRNVLVIVQQLLSGGISANQDTSAQVITQTIDAQLRQMDFAIGIWLILAMVFSAYLLAGITLRPVKRAMDRQKRFMANISHELRTPVSVMRTTTEATLLGGAEMTQAEITETLKSNLDELDRMAKIIEFLLDFSNLENRLTRLPFSTVDVVEAARRSIGMMKLVAETKHLNLTLTGADTATLSGNLTAIEEMISNLVKNAIAYTRPGGSVNVHIIKKFGVVTISVQDTGVGISSKDAANIFEAFYRGDNVVSIQNNGSVGLGLAIVKEIATYHGGVILVDSEVGKGTTIRVRLPGRFTRWLALPQ